MKTEKILTILCKIVGRILLVLMIPFLIIFAFVSVITFPFWAGIYFIATGDSNVVDFLLDVLIDGTIDFWDKMCNKVNDIEVK